MHVRPRIVFASASLAIGAIALVACFDLLHSTSDVLTACEIDAARPGCSTTEAVDTDFCAFTSDQAREHALHACAWLGACETPIGNNAFGPCYFRALMAYDCALNPNHPSRNDTHRLWDCLQRVNSCGDVDSCIFADAGVPECKGSGPYTACTDAASLERVRVQCPDATAGALVRTTGENCALWGQTCAPTVGGSVCAGQRTVPCDASGCSNDSLNWCDDTADAAIGVDLGIDCASNGAAACGGFPTPTRASWVACEPVTDASADAGCEPNASASCQNGLAVSCPSGIVETIDCAGLLGGGPAACNEGPLVPPFDWTSPCGISPPQCTSDSCSGTSLTSCERGAPFIVSCESERLGPCQMIQAEPGAPPRAACTPPGVPQQ